jgi:hypothetical protein
VEIVKSQGKDWNQDLKQDQLQRVVKEQLGEVDEDQYGFGQLHWDNPRFEGDGKVYPGPQIDWTARAAGERVLVVEFRENRDEVSQLPALRDNLERVGLVIDHAVKMEPQAAREIATALTLRYQLSSPQLLLISDAVDALSANLKVRVVEAVPDAAERRQLAAAQLEQRQKGPALVPSDSPAHDQTRLLFIEAAAWVAKELRGYAANLDAARLQEVSKQLLTKPALTGVNQENVEKVLAVVDTLDALKTSPAVAQLRQAAHALHTPAVASQEARQRIGPRL